MQKQKQTETPGTVLQALLEKYDLNCNRLAKAINMSNAMVRLLVLDKSPISVTAAFRLARFFKMKPEFWLSLQMQHDLNQAANDKALAKEVSAITDIDKYSFVRKPHTAQSAQKKAAPAAKPGRKASALAGAKAAPKAGKKTVPDAKPGRKPRAK